MRKSSKVFEWMIYLMPAVLFFSYYPVITLGSNDAMNFELSLPILWLVFFDIFALILMVKTGKCNFQEIWKKWRWLLFPIFASLSLFWTDNLVRGILTVGILWLIYFAVFSFFTLREILSANFSRNFFRAFFGAGILAVLWCVLQCILDVMGVSRECTLMCAGCVTEMFGFPHPNGFAIEPQFMGNLLLAPAIVSVAMVAKKRATLFPILMLFVFAMGLFLTFSRGAIYAFIVALVFEIVFEVWRRKNWRIFLTVPIILVAFLFTLNLQGIFAQVSRTNDTYFTGVAKVLNHLSLGIIDIRGEENTGARETGVREMTETEIKNGKWEVLAQEDLETEMALEVENEAIFDGYVEESTNTRLELSEKAIKVWSQDLQTMVFGVGIGGAGEAMFRAGEIVGPKTIVQNQYVSLLLEVGLIGGLLFVLTIVLAIRATIKSKKNGIILALIVAYLVTLLFFSGLPNALQVYLMPAALILCNQKTIRARS